VTSQECAAALGMSVEDANSRSTNHTPRSTFCFNGMSGALGFAWLASHLHLLFFLVLNKFSIREEHLQILSICIEEAKQRASVGSSGVLIINTGLVVSSCQLL